MWEFANSLGTSRLPQATCTSSIFASSSGLLAVFFSWVWELISLLPILRLSAIEVRVSLSFLASNLLAPTTISSTSYFYMRAVMRSMSSLWSAFSSLFCICYFLRLISSSSVISMPWRGLKSRGGSNLLKWSKFNTSPYLSTIATDTMLVYESIWCKMTPMTTQRGLSGRVKVSSSGCTLERPLPLDVVEA